MNGVPSTTEITLNKMEVQSNDVQIVIKNVESEGIIISNAKQFSAKEEDIKTTEYFLNIEEQSADAVEDTEAQFVTVEGDDNEYIAVEIDGSEQIILDNKEVIIFTELCRICASESDRFIPIFSGEGLEHDLSEKIYTYLPLRVFESDTLPLQVCYNCAATLLSWHEMVQNCVNAQQRLTELQNKFNSKEQYYNESAVDDDNDITDTAANKAVNEEAQVQSENENEIDETMQVVDISEANRSGTSPRLLKTSENQIASEKSVKKSNTQSTKSADSHCRVTVADFAKSSPGPETSLDDISKKDDVESAEDEPDTGNALKKGKKRKAAKESYACEECGKQFKFKDSFVRHQRIHKDERPFTCYVCGKQFRDSGGLCRHLRDVHDRVKNFECETCGRCFASKATRDDHQRTHTGERPYVCHSCGKSFKSKASLYTHSKLHTDEFPHACLHCGRKFRRRQEMLCHVSMHTGEKNFECDICFKRFRIKTELKRHLLIHSDEKPFQCAICDFRSKQRRYLNNHVKHKHSLIERKEEMNACLNLSGEVITILTVSPQPPDPLAPSSQRKRRRKPPRVQGEPSWKVKKKLNSTRRLQDAPELVQRRAEAAQARVIVDGATLYKCPECEKLLSTAYNYFAHKRIHTQEKLCTCEICGKSFTASSSLTRHMREVHDKIKDFKCSYCDRKLASKISRDEHERTHTDERPHVCDVCGKRFRQRASLSVHKRFHSKSTLFSCRECNRGFPRKQDMERHELTHTDQKPYACKVCDRKFRSSASAIRHRQTHDGEQKHTCKTCGVSFSQRRYLKNHVKNVHNDV